MLAVHEISGRFGAVLLLLTLLAAPWFYGGVTEQGQMIIGGGLVLSGLCALLHLLSANRFIHQSDNTAGRLVLTSLPLLLLILLGILQTVPFPEKIMKKLSPGILEFNAELLPTPGSEECQFNETLLGSPFTSFPPTFTMSVYPRATRDFLAFLTSGLLAFFSAGILFATPDRKRVFWTVITVGGLLLALFIIMTQTVPETEFYQRIWPGAHCGPYVNKNNAAGYLCLCLGPAVSLMALSVRSPISDREWTGLFADGVNRHLPRMKSIERIAAETQSFFDFSNRFALFGFAAVGILFAATAVSLSRGGTLGASFALMLAICLLLSRRRLGFLLFPLWGALILGLILIVQLGLNEPVQERMGTLFGPDPETNAVIRDGRPTNWQAAIETTLNVYHGRGSGLGTYANAIRENDVATRHGGIFEHAENQFVETILTAGIPGIILLATFVILFGILAVVSLLHSPDEEWDDSDDERRGWLRQGPFAAGMGTAVLLAGQMVAGSFDFGLCLTANFILLAALCGSFAAGFSENAPFRFGRRRLFAKMTLSLLLAVAVIGGFFGTRRWQNAQRIETILQETAIDPDSPKLRLDTLDWNIAQLEKAAQDVPDDIRLPYQTALLRVARYRLLAMQAAQKERPDAKIRNLWDGTDPILLHHRVTQLETDGMTVWPERFRSDPLVTENLLPAEQNAITARNIAPIFPDPHLLYGTLLPLVSTPDTYSGAVSNAAFRASKTARYETRVLYLCGVLEYISGEKKKADVFWQRSISLSPKYLSSILACVTRETNPDNLYNQLKNLIGGDFDLLERTAGSYPKKTHPAAFDAVLRLMREALDQAPDKVSGQYFRNSARLNALADRPKEAEEDYLRALKIEPRRADWCYECAQILLDHDELDRSATMLEQALQIDPHRKAYQTLLEKVRERKQRLLFNEFPDTEPAAEEDSSVTLP